jgi:hypothetical protein
MAISELYSGTEAVSTTEWSLVTDTSYDTGDASTVDGVFQAFLDVSDMVVGDILQVRIYEKCRSGDTQRVAFEAILRDVQSQPIFVTPSLILMHGWDVTCDALVGTITVLWSVRQVA